MNVIESRKFVGTSLQNVIRRQVQMPLVTYSDTDDGNLRRRGHTTMVGLERQITEIDFETNLEYETISLQWRLIELDKLLQKALIDRNSRVLTSPTFKDSSERTWWLRLRLFPEDFSSFPVNDDDNTACSSDGMSLYLYSKRSSKDNQFPTRFHFLLSFLDKDKKISKATDCLTDIDVYIVFMAVVDGVGGHCTDVIFQPNKNGNEIDNWGAENIVSASALNKLAERGEVYLQLELKIWLEPITHLILAREVR